MRYLTNLGVLIAFLFSTVVHAVPPVDKEGRQTLQGTIYKDQTTTPIRTIPSGNYEIYPKNGKFYQRSSTNVETLLAPETQSDNYVTNYGAETDTSGWSLLNGSASTTSTSTTVDELGDSVNINQSLRFIEGQQVVYTTSGTVIGGLASGNYFIRNPTGNSTSMSFQLSAIRNGPIVDLTSDGVGTQNFLAFEPGNGEGSTVAGSVATFTRETVASGWPVLRGTGSFVFAHPSSSNDLRGIFFKYPFTVQVADQGKSLPLTFSYAVPIGTAYGGTDATFANATLKFSVYDVASKRIIAGPLLASKHSMASGQFKLDVPTIAGSANYIIIANYFTTNSYALGFVFDDVRVGTTASPVGAYIGEWVDFTPTGTWVANSTYTGRWRQVGTNAEIQFSVSTTGAPTTGQLLFNMPSGMVIDTAKVVYGGTAAVAPWRGSAFNGTSIFDVAPYVASGSQIAVRAWNAGSTYSMHADVTQAVPFTFANGHNVQVTISVPIVGWKTNLILSTDNPGQPINVRRYGTSAQTLTSTLAKLTIYGADGGPNTGIASTPGWDTTNNRWVFPFKDCVNVHAQAYTNATTASGNNRQIAIYKNGQQSGKTISRDFASGGFGYTLSIDDLVCGVAGDYIEIWASAEGSSQTAPIDNQFTYLTIKNQYSSKTYANNYTAPQIYKYTTGSGTFTVPNGASYLRVRMVGGGGGGGGSGNTAGKGGDGVASTFGTSLLTANGGLGGNVWYVGNGGAGTSATINSPANGTIVKGSSGDWGKGGSATYHVGGLGGTSMLGGGGQPGSVADPGGYGGGGGGAQNSAGTTQGSGGGGGGAGGIDAIIPVSNGQTFAYTVGTGGVGGTAGTSGFIGTAGTAGYIEVSVYFQNAGESSIPQNIIRTANTQGENVDSARISITGSACVISNPKGNWISSLTYNGTGDCTLTFTSGYYSSIPDCVVGSEEGSGVTVLTSAKIYSPTSSSIGIRHSFVASGSSTVGGTNNPVHIICKGR